MARGNPTEAQWARLEPMLPKGKERGLLGSRHRLCDQTVVSSGRGLLSRQQRTKS